MNGSRCHSRQNISCAVNTDKLQEGNKARRAQFAEDVAASGAAGDALNVGQMNGSERQQLHVGGGDDSPQFAHPLGDSSRPQIEAICIFPKKEATIGCCARLLTGVFLWRKDSN